MITVYILWGIKGNQRNILGVFQHEHTARQEGYGYDDSCEYTEVTSHELIQSMLKK